MGRALALMMLLAACSEAVPVSSEISVVSFNVRFGTARDGPNAWEHRKDLVIRQLDELDADIVGAQEMLPFQSDYVEARRPDHTRIGVGRIDGVREGEYSAIYFRTSRFEKMDEGHFWLSETPQVVGSRGWDAQLPRVATWVRLRDRIGNIELFVLNAHFDHVGELARAESSRLVRDRVDEEEDAWVLVTGDFNSAPSGAPYDTMVGGGLVDTFRAVNPSEQGGTFHGFGELVIDARIDWIMADRRFRVAAAAIERTTYDGRYPSDHHAVSAKLEITESASPVSAK